MGDENRRLVVEYLDPRDLRKHPMNWRTHPERQREAIAGSLRRHGWVAPVVVNKATGNIIDGHARIEAAILSDEQSVPCVVLDVTEIEEKQILASLDKIGELRATDDAMILKLVAELKSETGDLPIGWNADDLVEARARLDKSLGVNKPGRWFGDYDLPDKLEDVPSVCKRGEVWRLGDHRVMCGDAYSELDVEKLFDGMTPDILHLDPPYGINLVSSESGRYRQLGYRPVEGDDKPFDPTSFMDLAETLIFWGANHYSTALPASPCWFVWDKQGGSKHVDKGDFEMVWTNLRKPARLLTHIWDGARKDSERGEPRYHPTQKPVAVIRYLLEWIPGQIVADLFLGSGTTLMACDVAGRRCLGMEIDPRYVDATICRWSARSGSPATRVA